MKVLLVHATITMPEYALSDKFVDALDAIPTAVGPRGASSDVLKDAAMTACGHG